MMIAHYHNGNTVVSLFENGTKVREYTHAPEPIFPESIDLKITNFCSLTCPYCHENSHRFGVHANVINVIDILHDLPAGVEIAIGGGNPLSHPDLDPFLRMLRRIGLVANITVNYEHIKEPFFLDMLTKMIRQKLIYGVGISLPIENYDSAVVKSLFDVSENVVFHVIVGAHKVEIMDQLAGKKVLVLGYKQFGRGVRYFSTNIENEIERWSMYIPKYMDDRIISFDNLAIQQLDMQRFFSTEEWEGKYMGDDFTFSMYLDGVSLEYAPNSTSTHRTSCNQFTLQEYFQRFKHHTGGTHVSTIQENNMV